jgi:hypothetical protein
MRDSVSRILDHFSCVNWVGIGLHGLGPIVLNVWLRDVLSPWLFDRSLRNILCPSVFERSLRNILSPSVLNWRWLHNVNVINSVSRRLNELNF